MFPFGTFNAFEEFLRGCVVRRNEYFLEETLLFRDIFHYLYVKVGRKQQGLSYEKAKKRGKVKIQFWKNLVRALSLFAHAVIEILSHRVRYENLFEP